MQITRQAPVRTSLEPSNHPYLSGPWTPVHEEVTLSASGWVMDGHGYQHRYLFDED